ncbi:MAG: SAM-dependent methyltransferase [Endomicrobium sp.]|jgi:type I restriction-modification system DNA methylase subunit|nr:SAM-dependent methyltransferase [Endomicrobium sp.]
MNEKNMDFFIGKLLEQAGIKFEYQGSKIKEISESLRTASKRNSKHAGRPEFTAKVNDFILVGEDKATVDLQAKYVDDTKQQLSIQIKDITKYAENGALHYARHIVENTNFKKVFAFGCSGDKRHYKIRPIFVDKNGKYTLLKEVNNFENFNSENINRYYREQVLREEPKEVTELKDILNRAKRLHEDLRNYAQLSDTEKPLVVSAILLSLNEHYEDQQGFINTLICDKVKSDGQKIYEAVSSHMQRVQVEPQVKLQQVLAQFNIIKTRVILSDYNKKLGKTPLRYFTEYLKEYVIAYTKANSPEDVLGRFYGEFMKYSGGDGQTLGVVLTPSHITELFCDLVDIKAKDIVFDPCCGTGGFLIAGLHKMLKQAKTKEQKENIKKNQIYGVELRDDMFSIATTNMILRGDGKSNLICADFLQQETQKLRKKNFSVGFMNPPYSQSKNKETAHLSEINFISRLLNSMADEARVVVIVPQSAMVGKTKEDKLVKVEILKRHTLQGVITLNKNTFYRIGTNACIAVFTAHKPHSADDYVKFINFEDDGFEVNKHIGLIETERAKEKKRRLLECWRHNKDAESKFMVKTKIEAEDEWLHSFYYFNDEIPTDTEFEKTMADYLTFEFNMIAHGRGYLFGFEDRIENE